MTRFVSYQEQGTLVISGQLFTMVYILAMSFHYVYPCTVQNEQCVWPKHQHGAVVVTAADV